MKTGSQTTYILLERGVEDVALRNEILDATEIICKAYGITSIHEFIERFPMLHEIQYMLKTDDV